MRSRRAAGVAAVGAFVLVVIVVMVVLALDRGAGSRSGADRHTAEAEAVTTTTTTTEAEVAAGVPAVVPVTTSAAVPTPAAPGGVGVRVLTLVDPARTTGARGSHGELPDRTLTVTVRYPDGAAAGPDEESDAEPYGPAPLVVFAHGFDVSQATYAPLLHDLAAAGFIVAAPEFPLSSSTLPGAAVEGDEAEQARDVSFVVDRLEDGSVDPDLTAAVRPGPVGLVGHSDGAVTVLLDAFSPALADPRVGAVVDASGLLDSYGGPWFSTTDPPLLSVHGGSDELNPLSADERLVDADPGAARLVVVEGASHLGALTGATEPAVARLIADELAWRLTGAPGGSSAVDDDAGQAPLRTYASHGS